MDLEITFLKTASLKIIKTNFKNVSATMVIIIIKLITTTTIYIAMGQICSGLLTIKCNIIAAKT